MPESNRLKALLEMLEQHLRRPLSPEERRLIALTEPWTDAEDSAETPPKVLPATGTTE